MNEQSSSFRYKAFISYSHADKRASRVLHRALESFRLPTRLADEFNLADNKLVIFRDRDELGSASDLSTSIEQSLTASEFLIVVCSPNAAQSLWVNKEIEYFLTHRDPQRVLCYIIEGQPPDCMPEALHTIEPLAADARRQGDGHRNARLKLIATLLHIPYGRLREREQRRRVQRLTATTLGSLFAMLAMGALTAISIQARNQADQRFEQVRGLSKVMMFDVYDRIANVPGTTSAREFVASTAQRYLEVLTADTDPSPDLTLDLAEGYARLYRILDRQAVSNEGKRQDAEHAWQKATSLLDGLVGVHADQARVHVALARLFSHRANLMLYVDNQPDASRSSLDQALAALSVVKKLQPDSPDIVSIELRARQYYADSYKWQNDYNRTLDALKPVQAATNRALRRWPQHEDLLEIAGNIAQLRGEAQYFKSLYQDAISSYASAIQYYQDVLAVTGTNQSVEDRLIVVYWSRANALIDTDRIHEANQQYTQAIEKLERHALLDPGDTTIARRLAILRGSNAMALVKLGRVEEAKRLIFATNAWFESHSRSDNSPGAHRSLAVSYQTTADILIEAGLESDACDFNRRTLATWELIDARFGLSDFDANEPSKVQQRIDSMCAAFSDGGR